MSAIETAKEIIHGDREKVYGHPSKNLVKIADQWSLYVKQKYDIQVELNIEDVCWMMALLKMARATNSYSDDNIVDALGYIALIDRCREPQQLELPL